MAAVAVSPRGACPRGAGVIPVFEMGEKGLVPAPKPQASFKDQGIRPGRGR